MNIRYIQHNLPWKMPYGKAFDESAAMHKDFQHALVHIVKAVGKLSAMIENADHDRASLKETFPRAEVEKYLADLIICAMRMANTPPDDLRERIDLEDAVLNRIEEKNGVRLVDPEPQQRLRLT